MKYIYSSLIVVWFSHVLLAETVFYDGEKEPVIKALTHELFPVTKTVFKVVNLISGKEDTIDLTGKNFIVVSVREKGSDGRFYAVDSDGTVWWSGPVTSGAPEFRSPSGIFPIIYKKRYHMSTAFPEESGVNNMDYMMMFTHNGHALHKGSVDWMSHGCIHIDPKDVPVIYNWSKHGMQVVVTRHSYMPFAKDDLRKIYLKR
ncbi:MAG TPA: L,D-transpeptidase [Sulfurovum sp.]|nr:L,D-transpeptidase [Sulfurovum sp.]